ncbi:hypothetical protein MKW92_002531 [Papaver armeniacum]|nr:hypothetical protein MKW92_002531 [Papaver armeniacum]
MERKEQQQYSERLRDDPPSKLIDQFLNLQRASGEVSLDMDLEMDELVNEHKNNSGLPPLPPKSTPTNSPIPQQPVRRRSSKGMSIDHENYQQQSINLQPPQQTRNQNCESPQFGGGGGGTDEFLRQELNYFLRSKTVKSRLKDPPADIMKSGRVTAKSVQLRSDSFAEKYDDIPDKYKKSSKFFTPLVIFQWVVLILILSAFVCSHTIHSLSKMTPWALDLWKWELILLVLICGRLLSGWGIRIVVFFVERNFILRKRVLYFVYGLRKAVQNCLWLGMDVIKDRTRIPFYVTKCLILLLVGTLLWLVKTVIVKMLASSFHVTTYFDRIQDSLFTQYVIETLSGPPVIEIQRNMEEDEQLKVEVENLQKAGCTMPADLRATALPPTPIMKKSGSRRVIGSGKIIQNGSPNVESGSGRNNTRNKKLEEAWKMKRLMNIIRHGVITTVDEHIDGDSFNEDESATTIRSESEAKSAATKIFNNVAKPYSKTRKLEKTMSQFEGAIETDKISKKSMKNWVIATTKFLVLISSQLLLVAFMFSNTCKMVFQAIIFLFVMHPFDVGDRCEVEDVQHPYTVFLRYDNQKIIYPNSVLSKADQAIYTKSRYGRCNRFPLIKDVRIWCLGDLLKVKKRTWVPSPMIRVRDVDDLNKVKNAGRGRVTESTIKTWGREEMIRVPVELDMEYRMLPLDINVLNMPRFFSQRFPQIGMLANNY